MWRWQLKTVCCRFEGWGLFRLWALWSRFWSWSSGEILKLEFGQYLVANVWLRLRSWILFNILKQDLVKFLTLDLVEVLMFGWYFDFNACNMFKICELWTEILWYELDPRVHCAFGNVLCVLMVIFSYPGWRPCTAMTKMRMMTVTMNGTRLQAFDQLQLEE